MIKKFKEQFSNIDVILVVIVLFLGWQLYTQHKNNVINTGYEYGTGKRVKVNTKIANSSWAYHENMFKNKMGEQLTPEYLSKEISVKEALENVKRVPLDVMYHNPDTIAFSNYQINGILLNKIRTSSTGSDYIILRSPVGDVRVYYFGSLPYQANNSPITVTGIVLGIPENNPNDRVSMISNVENTQNYKKAP